jgi:signal transduction histidine kinase
VKGLLGRLEVRLVLALASVALVALVVSGVTLSQILPSYLEEQARQQLQTAGGGTGLLISLRAARATPSELDDRESRETELLQGAAQAAADAFSVGNVTILNARDGSRAASASPSDPSKLLDQGLRPDLDVAAYELRTGQSQGVYITLGEPDPPLTEPFSTQLHLRVVVSLPYTTQALTLSRVTSTLMIVGVLALALSGLLGVFVARRLTGPMNRLRRVSARLALGELDQRASPSGVVEIDQLGAQFNIMADRLSESLRLLQADRDRLREFVADVSHELRTPIAALRTFTELQRDGSIDEATREEFLERSSEQLRRLEWLSTNLLDLSRIEAGIFPLDVREGDVREPVRSVVEAHAELAEERGVSLVAAVPSQQVTLRFDRERIVQLVTNLVGNGLKFTQRGGQVDVELRDDGEEVVLEVRDTGPGIPERELPRIFERFYRGTNVGEARASGSGLGLAIARSIVEMHRGSIEVASAVGKGTRLLVSLPRLLEVSPVPSPVPPRPARLPGLRRSRTPVPEPAPEHSVGEP